MEEEADLEVKVKALEDKLEALKTFNPIPANTPAPRYDGQGDFHNFLRKFNIYATASNWEPKDCVRFLPLFLSGDALEIYMGLDKDQINTWKKLTEAMAKKTGKIDARSSARRMLAKMRMKIGDSVNEFANRIKNLVEEAMPDPDYTKDARSETERDYFLDGLPTEIKRKVFFQPKPKDLMEAISMVKKITQIKKELASETVAQLELDEVRAEVNAIAYEMRKKNEEEQRERDQWRKERDQWSVPRGEFRGQGRTGNYNRNSARDRQQNANFEPLGPPRFPNRGRGWNENYRGNWNRRGGGRPGQGQWENRGYGEQNRGWNEGRGGRGRGQGFRGQQRYRINAVGTEPSSSAANRQRSPSPFFPLIVLCTILGALTTPTFCQYQICSENFPTTPIGLPKPSNCTIPEKQQAVERKVTLFLPITTPKQFPIYGCTQQVVEVCTESIFIFWHDIKSRTYKEYSVPPEKCRSMVTERHKMMTRVNEYEWKTNNAEKVKYAWTGEDCEETTNFLVEKGEGGILSLELVTSWGHHLNPYKEYDVLETGTVIWDKPEESFWRTHMPTEKYKAEITEEAVVISEIEAVFQFEEGDREGVIGVPEEAHRMINDAYILIHTPERPASRRKRSERESPKRREQNERKAPAARTTGSQGNSTVPTAKITTTMSPTTERATTTETPTTQSKITTTGIPKTIGTTMTTTVIPMTVTPRTTKITTTVTVPKLKTTTEVLTTTITLPTPKRHILHLGKQLPSEQLYWVVQQFGKPETTPRTTVVTPEKRKSTKVEERARKITKEAVEEVMKEGKKRGTGTAKTEEHTMKESKKVASTSGTEVVEPSELRTAQITKIGDNGGSQMEWTPEKKEREKKGESEEEEGGENESGANAEERTREESEEREGKEDEDEGVEDYEEDEEQDVGGELEDGEEGIMERKRRTTVTTPMSEEDWNRKKEKARARMEKGQETKNLNTRVNYAIFRLNEEKKREYNDIFRRACESSNLQLRLAEAIVRINPTEGARQLFNRDDLTAKWTTEGLEVAFCAQVTPEQIFWDGNVDGRCYEKTPIRFLNHTMFIQPGSRDLVVASKTLECGTKKSEEFLNKTHEEELTKMKLKLSEEYEQKARWTEKLPIRAEEMKKESSVLSDRINFEGCAFEGEDRQKLKEVVDRNAEAFVGADGKIGCYNGPVVHRIDLIPGALPVHRRAYRQAPPIREAIDKQIEEMMAQNVIRPSQSEFASRYRRKTEHGASYRRKMVPKKDRTWRFAIDYRGLNSITQKRVYQLPIITELLDTIGSKKYFTSVDLQSGYHQIPMRPEDIPKTAFICHSGLYEFLRMPFGLISAGDTFQRVMEGLRRQLTACVLAYLDDIIVASTTPEEHLEDLENLLKVLIKAGLKLRIDKCSFARKEIKYLGYLVSEEGVRCDPRQLEAIQRFTKPKTLTELRSLVGALSYFRKFVPNFAHIIRPLNRLITKEAEGRIAENWKKEHEEALEVLKFLLMTPPVLKSPNFSRPFEIETDASQQAIAAVLLQEGHPIAYSSRALSKAEQKFHVNELEALAVAFAVEEYEPYIAGAKNTVVWTDNSTLCAMMKANRAGLRGTLLKYQMSVQSMGIDIRHRSGRSNRLCDYMSRYLDFSKKLREEGGEGKPNEERREEDPRGMSQINRIRMEELDELRKIMDSCPLKTDLAEVRAKQKKVKLLAALYRAKKWDKWPEDQKERKKIENLAKDYDLIEGAVHYTRDEVPRLVIPYELRERLFKEEHEHMMQGGHLSGEKTWNKMKKRMFWEGMKEDVEEMAKACEMCQKRKIYAGDKKATPVQPIEAPSGPWKRVHVDLIGPLKETTRGNKYVLMSVDAFTKWAVASALPRQDAATVARDFVKDVLLKHGVPNEVITDQGRQFVAELFQEISTIFAFTHRTTTSYHQQANGQVEVLNKIIGNIIATKIENVEWDSALDFAVFAYNTAITTSTKPFSPFSVLYLREVRLPSDNLLKLPATGPTTVTGDMSHYTQTMMKAANIAWRGVKEGIERAQQEYKARDDKQRRAEEREFKLGQLVLKANEGRDTDKFRKKWIGPFRVVAVDEKNANLLLRGVDGSERVYRVHMSKCKHFHQQCLLPLRTSDEPLEKFWDDPNIEESEEEKSEEEEPKDTRKSQKKMDDRNLEKEEESEEEHNGQEEGKEDIEERRVAFISTIGMRQRSEEKEEEEELDQLTWIRVNGAEQWAMTRCGRLGGRVPLGSLIPRNMVQEDWVIKEEKDGANTEGRIQYVLMKSGKRDWTKFYTDDLPHIILGRSILSDLAERWQWRLGPEGTTQFWEYGWDEANEVLRREIRVPEFDTQKKPVHEEQEKRIKMMARGWARRRDGIEWLEIKIDGRKHIALADFDLRGLECSIIPKSLVKPEWDVREARDVHGKRRKFVRGTLFGSVERFELRKVERTILGIALLAKATEEWDAEERGGGIEFVEKKSGLGVLIDLEIKKKRLEKERWGWLKTFRKRDGDEEEEDEEKKRRKYRQDAIGARGKPREGRQGRQGEQEEDEEAGEQSTEYGEAKGEEEKGRRGGGKEREVSGGSEKRRKGRKKKNGKGRKKKNEKGRKKKNGKGRKKKNGKGRREYEGRGDEEAKEKEKEKKRKKEGPKGQREDRREDAEQPGMKPNMDPPWTSGHRATPAEELSTGVAHAQAGPSTR